MAWSSQRTSYHGVQYKVGDFCYVTSCKSKHSNPIQQVKTDCTAPNVVGPCLQPEYWIYTRVDDPMSPHFIGRIMNIRRSASKKLGRDNVTVFWLFRWSDLPMDLRTSVASGWDG
jgi:hypothetical protein